jgi:hypothetical protein
MKKIITATIFILLFLTVSNVFSQQAFRYQAVARDSTGAVIANQVIGVQISIILDDTDNPPIYVEMHQVQSNDYGVINLNVGDGVPTIGDFSTINWQQTAFVKVEMDVEGGTDYSVMSLSEILSVPRALYAERAGMLNGSPFGLYVTDFGAVGNGTKDDTDAFEAALDSAFVVGAKVFVPSGVYRLTRTLILKDGVRLIGEGQGSEPLQTPHNGSLLRYEGNGFAIKIVGHNAQLYDLVLRDQSGNQAQGGVHVLADGRLVEGVSISEVLISGFTNGTALKLEAKNSGGIAYAAFGHVRVRHGKVGLHITEGVSSFVNSNTFEHCQISGGGFDYGILLDGGNNNAFYNVVIEPPVSTFGHLFVNKGRLYGSEIRIEGNNQPATTPLIYFAANTLNSTISGIYAGGLTIDKGNNFINMQSGKAAPYRNSSANRFRNATFFTPNGTTVTDWDITGTGVTATVLAPELTDKHNVLKLTIPAGSTARLEPSVLARPQIKQLAIYKQVNFGFNVKTDKAGTVYTSTNAPSGWTISTPHSGSNEWEFVSMNAFVHQTQPAQFRLEIANTTGGTMEVFVTTPTLTFGNQLPILDEMPLSTAGGVMNGQITAAVATQTIPANGYLTLPLNANYYEISGTVMITRINHLVANRAPKGTVITLLFDTAGIKVANNGYIMLKGAFTSIARSSLTLMSNGDGTWKEVDRNN